jgi:general secretion pathway protein C
MKAMFTKTLGYSVAAVLAASCLAFSQADAQAENEAEMTLLLEGVIITSEPGSSIALVRRPDARRARSVRVGESVYGMTLVGVTREAARFERKGSQLLVYLDGGRLQPSLQVAENTEYKGSSRGDDKESTSFRISGMETNTWLSREFERTVAEQRLTKEMPVILAETGLSPRVEGGEAQGIQITHLPDGTLLSEIGLLPGDVLLSVNDVPLTSLSALTSIFPQLRSKSEIRLIVERRGETLGLAYHIR